jgi:hypothetical protein
MKRILSTEYTEWQRQLSGELSIMIEKLAQAGESGGSTPIPFHYIYHHVQSCGVCTMRVQNILLHLFLLCPYTL